MVRITHIICGLHSYLPMLLLPRRSVRAGGPFPWFWAAVHTMSFSAYWDSASSLLPGPALLLCICASTTSPPQPIGDTWGGVWFPPGRWLRLYHLFPLAGCLAFGCLSFWAFIDSVWARITPIALRFSGVAGVSLGPSFTSSVFLVEASCIPRSADCRIDHRPIRLGRVLLISSVCSTGTSSWIQVVLDTDYIQVVLDTD